MNNILFISNGFAEDLIVIKLIEELRKISASTSISVLPIVSDAKHFAGMDVEIIGPHWNLPSEGITFEEGFSILTDIKGGLIQLIWGQIRALRKVRKKIDLVIGVGDYISILANYLFVKKPFLYAWVCPIPHFPKWSKRILKKYCQKIFSRIPREEYMLKDAGIPMEFVGNPLLDTFEVSGENFGLDKSIPTIGLLPGSREPAYHNLPIMLEAVEKILKEKKTNFIVAISPRIDQKRFAAITNRFPQLKDKVIFTPKYGDVLNTSTMLISLARTGSEQSIAMGKPVVTFWGGGHSMSKKLVTAHAATLIQDAGIVVKPDASTVAQAVLSFLDDPEKMKKMGQRGKELMGPRGGAKIIAQQIKEFSEK